MILKDIHLYPDLVEFDKEVTSRVRFETRCVCNFLEREALRKTKFQADFRRLCVIGKSRPEKSVAINTAGAACVDVEFDPAQHRFLASDAARHEFYIGLLESALRVSAGRLELPTSEITEGLSRFRAGGYVNEWTHKKKKLPAAGIVATLNCRLAMSEFALDLIVERDKSTVFSDTILETKPDELIFSHKFKDVVLDDRGLVVTSGTSEPLVVIPPARIS